MKKLYEELFLESRHLGNVFKGEISPLAESLKKEIIGENFKLGKEQFDDDIIYRSSDIGNVSGITACYSRRLKSGKGDFNNYENVIEEIDFFKDGNHTIFMKGDWLVRLSFVEKDLNKVRELLLKTRNIINMPRKIISIDPVSLENEVRAEFRGSPDIKHEIYFAYKVLRDYVSKSL